MSAAHSTVCSPPRLRVPSPLHWPRIMVSMVAITLCSSCSSGATDVPEDTPGRAEFIGAYIDLRTAAMSAQTTDIGDELRDSILAVYDVTEQDLLDFVDMHGEDVGFMRDLWTEIETLLTERLEQQAQDEQQDEDEERDEENEADAL